MENRLLNSVVVDSVVVDCRAGRKPQGADETSCAIEAHWWPDVPVGDQWARSHTAARAISETPAAGLPDATACCQEGLWDRHACG